MDSVSIWSVSGALLSLLDYLWRTWRKSKNRQPASTRLPYMVYLSEGLKYAEFNGICPIQFGESILEKYHHSFYMKRRMTKGFKTL